MAGYSASGSDSTTQAMQKTLGPFQVGGGVRIPEWFWPVTVLAAATVLIVWLTRPRK